MNLGKALKECPQDIKSNILCLDFIGEHLLITLSDDCSLDRICVVHDYFNPFISGKITCCYSPGLSDLLKSIRGSIEDDEKTFNRFNVNGYTVEVIPTEHS